MSNFDDIFEGNAPRKGQTNQPFDKEAWAEKSRPSVRRSTILQTPRQKLSARTAVNSRRIWMCRPGSAVILPPMCC